MNIPITVWDCDTKLNAKCDERLFFQSRKRNAELELWFKSRSWTQNETLTLCKLDTADAWLMMGHWWINNNTSSSDWVIVIFFNLLHTNLSVEYNQSYISERLLLSLGKAVVVIAQTRKVSDQDVRVSISHVAKPQLNLSLGLVSSIVSKGLLKKQMVHMFMWFSGTKMYLMHKQAL